ncbi:hypothetical protein [Calidithermus timidus]|jgi:hypothetical protein|uniref:hypothetical protein n=1 Tax=Calidithermus timidus TaxID=307124 RepID=UPI00036C4F6F|nr:hypothetical protein [Calidithermus timidus]
MNLSRFPTPALRPLVGTALEQVIRAFIGMAFSVGLAVPTDQIRHFLEGQKRA